MRPRSEHAYSFSGPGDARQQKANTGPVSLAHKGLPLPHCMQDILPSNQRKNFSCLALLAMQHYLMLEKNCDRAVRKKHPPVCSLRKPRAILSAEKNKGAFPNATVFPLLIIPPQRTTSGIPEHTSGRLLLHSEYHRANREDAPVSMSTRSV